MPSRSNPNTPSSLKPKTARTLKAKRQKTQRIVRNRISKSVPRTSQAIRRAAVPSQKKARKLERKQRHARKRKAEMGEVEMKDAFADTKKEKRKGFAETAKADEGLLAMDVDVVE
ncbi:hypothetical protein MMC07_008366 [Pseudocyphellaria aurata]|nr:hypothetical protein [Pseudocyphellaria aurata]